MRIVALAALRKFWAKHADAEQPLKAWHDEVSRARWKHPADIKRLYRHASILQNRRVVFNLKGDDYRLVVAVAYQIGVVHVKFVGTHKQYDLINANTVES
jgi:mRNA interferase HigB